MPPPPRYRLILAPEATRNLQSIYDFIRKDSPQGAVNVVSRILRAISKLDRFPHRNLVEHHNKKIKHPVRSLPVRPYIVYFRVIESQRAVRVLTVRHGTRRRPRRFQ
jgi:plasmid stabilization system protein ParE